MAGVNQIFSLAADDVAKYVKVCGKRFLPETKPSIFHGINPTISYAPSGKTFELPRFCSQEMQQARKLNQIAIRQTKQSVNPSFPKATVDDLRRLTSETIEDSYSRAQWTNPKDGKVYNLLKQGQTDDGKVIVRILDEEGGFVKEAALESKNIVMVDAQTDVDPFLKKEITHGQVVSKFIQRNNPFANIISIDVTGKSENYFMGLCIGQKNIVDADLLAQTFRSLAEKFKRGEKIDYITISIGCEHKAGAQFNLLDLDEKALEAMEYLSSVSKGRTRILFSAGNKGKEMLNSYLTAETVEGVGALDRIGKVTSYSASRNSKFTQHYEVGDYVVKDTEYGLNITGVPGTDISYGFNKSYKEMQEYMDELSIKRDIIDEKISKSYKLWYIARKKGNQNRAELLNEIHTRLNQEWESVQNELYSICENINQLQRYVGEYVQGTSFSTPVRTAKLALNDMMDGILD